MARSRGFTIVEIVVVLAIIAILVGISVVVLRTTPAHDAAVALASELTAARLHALSTGRPTAVILSEDRTRFRRVAAEPGDDAPTACARATAEHRLELAHYPLVSVTRGLEDGIVWFPAGWGRTCDGGGVYNGRIVLQGPRARYGVVVSSAGRVRWEGMP